MCGDGERICGCASTTSKSQASNDQLGVNESLPEHMGRAKEKMSCAIIIPVGMMMKADWRGSVKRKEMEEMEEMEEWGGRVEKNGMERGVWKEARVGWKWQSGSWVS